MEIGKFRWRFTTKMISFNGNAEQQTNGEYNHRNMSQAVFFYTMENQHFYSFVVYTFNRKIRWKTSVNRLIAISDRWMHGFFFSYDENAFILKW